jgi:hypothetical protein
MNWKTLTVICSSHHKRGEEVLEFNLSPHYFKDIKQFTYRKKIIPIVSEGWTPIGDYYYKELITSVGILFTYDVIYKIK